MTFAKGVKPAWRVLPECESKTHNSVHSVTKASPRCICPRALIIREEYLEKQRNRVKTRSRDKKLAQLSGKKVRQVMKELEAIGASRTGEMMTMEGGLCTGPAGMRLSDLAQDTAKTDRGVSLREGMKRLCAACPVQPRCLAETKRLESPPGVWGGVWGGQDMWERAGAPLRKNAITGRWQPVREGES